jgi:hypothetical protein
MLTLDARRVHAGELAERQCAWPSGIGREDD